MPALKPWPAYNQRKGLAFDDDKKSENADNNCGPTSVAMCLKYLTGVEIPADFIKDVMYGPEYLGYTYDNELRAFLEKRCDIPCEAHSGTSKTLLRPTVEAAIDAGYPIIVLYFWKLDTYEGGHWAPVIAYDEAGCTRQDPWTGLADTWSWAKFEQAQNRGHCIVLKRKRDPNLGSRDLDTELDPTTLTAFTMIAEAEEAGYEIPDQGGDDVLRDLDD